MKTTRCDEIKVLLYVRDYDELGRPTDERVIGQSVNGAIEPMTVFRNAETQDFWGNVVDKAVKAMVASQKSEVAPPSPEQPKGRRLKK